MEPSVQFEVDGPVALVTLSAQERENRLDPAMVARLRDVVVRAQREPEIRVIILRAAGAVFSNGMDLGRLIGAAGETSGGELRKAIEAYSQLLRSLSSGPRPTICVLNAPVRAGGVGLVAACDIVVATERATLELSEVRFGLVPANVLPYLLGFRMSPQRARYLTLTARTLTAAEAVGFGLVDELCDSAELEKRVRAVVKGLLRSSPEALATAKQVTGEWTDLPRGEAIDRAIELLESLAADAETRKQVERFAEGELPPWFARYKPKAALSAAEEETGE